MYYRARYYNPGIGRFVSEDPIRLKDYYEGMQSAAGVSPFLDPSMLVAIPKGFSQTVDSTESFYTYTSNNPTNRKDPSGMAWNPITLPLCAYKLKQYFERARYARPEDGGSIRPMCPECPENKIDEFGHCWVACKAYWWCGPVGIAYAQIGYELVTGTNGVVDAIEDTAAAAKGVSCYLSGDCGSCCCNRIAK
jgi:hypothetical protein